MSFHNLFKSATPATPQPGKITIWCDTDGRMKQIDENGVVSALADAAATNLLVNGGFDLAQRQVLTTVTTYSIVGGRTYAPDRWWLSNENASIDYAAVDTMSAPETGLTARFYGRIRKITALGKFAIGQAIEGVNMGPLRGRVVRLQAKMKYSPNPMSVKLGMAYLTGSGTIDVIPTAANLFYTAWGAASTDPTLGANLSYILPTLLDGGALAGSGMLCVLTPAWARYSATFLVPLTAKNLIPMIWTNGQPAINDILQVSECGLYDGPEIVDWTPRLISDEIPICQRYYHKTFPVLTAPATNAGLAGAVRGYVSVAGATAGQPLGVRYPVIMRAAPTITVFNPSAANAFVRNTTAGSDATASAGANIGDTGADITFTGIAAWTVAQAVAAQYTAESEI